jgi:citrate synthase
MGFGHRVYRVRDPRAEVLSEARAAHRQWAGGRALLDLFARSSA